MATVCLENVSKHYAQHIILDNIYCINFDGFKFY